MRRVRQFTKGSLRSKRWPGSLRGIQHPHGGSQSFLTLVPGDLTLSSSLLRYMHAHSQNTHVQFFKVKKEFGCLFLVRGSFGEVTWRTWRRLCSRMQRQGEALVSAGSTSLWVVHLGFSLNVLYLTFQAPSSAGQDMLRGHNELRCSWPDMWNMNRGLETGGSTQEQQLPQARWLTVVSKGGQGCSLEGSLCN